jgi:hypothetical protein
VAVAGTALVGSSIVGGVVSVLAGTNTWSDAWTAKATLAAPWPMLLLQTAATLAAISPRRALSLGGTALLSLTAAVAGISGFFDGQLGRSDLSTWYVAVQIGYVLVAWATVVVAAMYLRSLLRGRRTTGAPVNAETRG